jgi:hypothetical protein
MTHHFRSPARVGRLVLIAASLALVTGCASITPIGDLNANAAKYDGKTVSIAGTVQGGAGGLGLGEYQVKDATGTLTVVSDNGSPPQSGSKVTVKGIFQALASLGPKSVAVLKEESRSE